MEVIHKMLSQESARDFKKSLVIVLFDVCYEDLHSPLLLLLLVCVLWSR